MCLATNTIKIPFMKNSTKEIGYLGENEAVKYLIKNKYKILFRNYKFIRDEIDIIAKSFDGVLVFVEVKTISLETYKNSNLIPEDHLTKKKIKNMIRASSFFIGMHKNLYDENIGWRLDLIAVVISEDATVVRHYENVISK